MKTTLYLNRAINRPSDLTEIADEYLINKIKSDDYKPLIDKIRQCVSKDERTRLKKTLPAFFDADFNGTKKRDSQSILARSYVVLDFDREHFNDYEEIFAKAKEHPWTYLAFKSPNGGLKVEIRAQEPILSKEWKEAYKYIAQKYSKEVGALGYDNTDDISRLCFFSYDSDAYSNDNSERVSRVWASLNSERGESPIASSSKVTDTLLSALEFLSEQQISYDSWWRVLAGLSTVGDGRELSVKYFANNPNYNDSEAMIARAFDSTNRSTDGSIGTGTIIHIAEEMGWQNHVEIKDIFKTPTPPRQFAIEGLIPIGVAMALVGETGAGKSTLSRTFALHLANGYSNCLGFKVPQKRRVLYFDFEHDEVEAARELKSLVNGYGMPEPSTSDFWYVPKPADFSNNFPLMNTCINSFDPEIIFIDNLYSANGHIDISDGSKVKGFLKQITAMRKPHLSIVLVHHFNKNTEDKMFDNGRMAGASSITWFLQNMLLIISTNRTGLKLLKADKNRFDMENNVVYGLDITGDEDKTLKRFKTARPIDGDKVPGLVIKEAKNNRLLNILADLPDKFDTAMILNIIENQMGLSKKTGHSYLNEMLSAQLVARLSRGLYKKTDIGLEYSE